MTLFLKKTHLLRCWDGLSVLNWVGALTLSQQLKLLPRKFVLWFVLWRSFLLRLLNISHGLAWNYCSFYLRMFDKLQKPIYMTVGPSLTAFLEPWAHRRNKASLRLFYRYYFGRFSFELAGLVPLPRSRGRSTRYSKKLHDFSDTIPKCYKDMYVKSFFSCALILWNCLPAKCFLWTNI